MPEQDRSIGDALRIHRRLLDGMLGSFSAGAINVIDRDLRYLYAAGTTFNRTGLSPDVFIGKCVRDLFPSEIVDQVAPFYARAFDGETVTFTVSAIGSAYQIDVWPFTEPAGVINAIVVIVREDPTPPSAEAPH